MYRKIVISLAFVLSVTASAFAQTRNFTPVEGANLKAKIDAGVTQGRASAPGGRFWVAYQFDVRPGVAVDFEIVSSTGVISISNDGWSWMDDPRYETRDLGVFMFYENARDGFTRGEVYNLKRAREFGNYPVYWAGRATNEESLNYLKSIVDSSVPEVKRMSDRAVYAMALHDDPRVESMLIEFIKRPVAEQIRNRAIMWLSYTPESQTKNNLLAEIVRNERDSSDARQQAMSSLGMSRAATNLPLLQTMYETMTSRELKRRALTGIGRNDNHDGAATFLIRIAENERDIELRKSAIANLGRIAGGKTLGVLTTTLDSSPELELQKQAVTAIGRRPKDEAIPILIRTARNHPNITVRKLAVQMLGHTKDERAVAFLNELLAK